MFETTNESSVSQLINLAQKSESVENAIGLLSKAHDKLLQNFHFNDSIINKSTLYQLYYLTKRTSVPVIVILVAKILLVINNTEIFNDMIERLIKDIDKNDDNKNKKNKQTLVQEIFINLGNELQKLSDMLKGSVFESKLNWTAGKVLSYAIENEFFNEDDSLTLNEKIKENFLKPSKAYQQQNDLVLDIIDDLNSQLNTKSGNIEIKAISDSIHEQMDLLSNTSSVSEQQELFSERSAEFLDILNKVPKKQSILWNKFLVILETMCFPSIIGVKITPDNNNENNDENNNNIEDVQKDIWLYKLRDEYSILTKRQETFDIFINLFTHILLSESITAEMHYRLTVLIERLWRSYELPQQRRQINDILELYFISVIDLYEKIKQIDDEQEKITYSLIITNATKFLQTLKLNHVDKKFISNLLADDNYHKIITNKLFTDQTNEIKCLEQDEQQQSNSIILNDLLIRAGQPSSAFIPAGSQFSQLICIEEPNSILHWGFATLSNDVIFSIQEILDLKAGNLSIDEAINQQKNSNIKLVNQVQPPSRIECASKAVKGSCVITAPGLYRLTWDNTYSWFTEKHLRFRVYILTPIYKDFKNDNYEKIYNSENSINNDEHGNKD